MPMNDEHDERLTVDGTEQAGQKRGGGGWWVCCIVLDMYMPT